MTSFAHLLSKVVCSWRALDGARWLTLSSTLKRCVALSALRLSDSRIRRGSRILRWFLGGVFYFCDVGMGLLGLLV